MKIGRISVNGVTVENIEFDQAETLAIAALISEGFINFVKEERERLERTHGQMIGQVL